MPTYNKRFYFNQQSGSKKSAREIVPIVLTLIRPKSVIDVGCGIGTWLSVFAEQGVSDFLGVDGVWVDKELLQIPKENFAYHDLTKPLEINRRFDLVVSLEVAEHLSNSYAQSFVDSLINLGPVVLFSAAIPYQGGAHHLNEQWPDFWVQLFGKRNYAVVDAVRRRIWQNNKVEYWYAQNTLIFIDLNSVAKYPLLKEELFQRTFNDQLSIVHPNVYLAKARATELNVTHAKQILQSLPTRIRNKLEKS
jgi:SAM-dependent methyltransferase